MATRLAQSQGTTSETRTTASSLAQEQEKVASDVRRIILRYSRFLPLEERSAIKKAIGRGQTQILPTANTDQLPIRDWPFPNDKVWHLKILIGEEDVDKAIEHNSGFLTGQAVIKLIEQCDISFYISNDRQCLSVGNSELMERDFGPLTPISAIEALKHVGLAGLEEARERGSVCL